MSDSIILARLLIDATVMPTDTGEPCISRNIADPARTHGVHALLYSLLDSESVLKKDQDLRNATFRQSAVYRLQDRELERICRKLYEAGVRSLLIKGAALCHQIYPSPELRPRVDTDIFIELSSLSGMKELLSSLGYESIVAHDGGLVSYQTGMKYTDECALTHTIDIHWMLTNRHKYRDILGFESIYASAVPISRFPFPVYAPNTIYALCLACIHLVGHHSDAPRLIWLYDIHLLLDQMADEEIEQFIELTIGNGLEDITSQALGEVNRHFSAERIPNILTRLGRHPGVALQSESPRELLVSNLRSFPTLSDKVKYLYALAFPSIEYMKGAFNPGSKLLIPWYYVYRIYRGGRKFLAAPAERSNRKGTRY